MAYPPDQKICLFCKSFHLSRGEPEYSEYTPGSPPEIFCSQGHFSMDPHEEGRCAWDTVALRDLMRLALTCPNFVHYIDDEEGLS